MREVLLRIASVDEPIRASDLWRRASREAHRMTPFAIADMWDLVNEGLLHYDSSAFVTVVDQRTLATSSNPSGGES